MMKMKATIDGRPILILGLSHGNLDRLRADGLNGHIEIDGKQIGLDTDIWITAAEAEAVMMQAFAHGIDAGTKIHVDKRFKS